MPVVTVKNAVVYNSLSGYIFTIKPYFSIKQPLFFKADISSSWD